ncbi:MAG TPA: SirB2 family protein [Steroidobacteraceae bacterium]|nr:SirB2 family protein [Steroidobacteraceae bacterium]
MLESYVALLGAHMLLAILSPLLFSLRAWRSIRGLEPARGWLRLTPHVVDSLLLLAGIALALIIRQYPFRDAWLTAKLLALIAYIIAGHVAVRRARRVRGKLTAWLIGLALVLYIFAVAITRSPAAGLA